jgi:hypothetical protein
MMSRKILMHLAVDVAKAKEGQTFKDYLKALSDKGYITTGLEPVVDSVRERGNAANHELPASTKEKATATLSVVEHLLRSVYELPSLASSDPE